MLKKILLVFCIAGCATIAKPQFINSAEYKAGISISALDWHLINSYGLNNHMFKDNFYGFSSAFSINYLDHIYWNISSQLSFLQIGGKDSTEIISPSAPTENIAIQNRMNYLSFITLIKLKYPINNFTPFLKIGPHIDYMISANNHYEEFNRLNYGLNLTAGMDLKLNENIYLTTDISYIWYVKKIEATNLEVSFTKYASVLFGFGYTFN